MTDTARIARGWALIAEGAMEISLAFEQPAADVGVSPPARASVPAATINDDLPPLTDADAPYEDAPRAAEKPANAALGVCPVHRTAWTVKAGGISKAGKPFDAFWKCAGKNDDGTYCNEKPTPGWKKSHPIPLDVAA